MPVKESQQWKMKLNVLKMTAAWVIINNFIVTGIKEALFNLKLNKASWVLKAGLIFFPFNKLCLNNSNI